jgi:DNA-binding CsgD family transcriptional regulator
MEDERQLSALIGSIYDAALDPRSWNEVLTRVIDFVDGHGAGLTSKNALSKYGNVHYPVGVDAGYVESYRQTYVYFDPTTTLPLFDVDEIVNTVDLVPSDVFQEGRFYREWAQPQGLVDAANAVLEKSVTSCAYLSVIQNKQQPLADDAMRRRLALVVPHVRRAVLIGKVIDRHEAEAAMFADIADGIGAGLLLLGASACIVYANAAGHALLRAGDVLRTVGGRLVAADVTADLSLREAFAAAGDGDAAVGVKGIAVLLTSHPSAPCVAHVLPLTSGERRRAGMSCAAVAALFVRRAALEAPSPPEVIAKTYKLTPTELRVLLAIVEVGGVPEVAGALGIAETTVKTHLGRLFEKTGTGRQADLVKVVAGFSSPLVNG